MCIEHFSKLNLSIPQLLGDKGKCLCISEFNQTKDRISYTERLPLEYFNANNDKSWQATHYVPHYLPYTVD